MLSHVNILIVYWCGTENISNLIVPDPNPKNIIFLFLLDITYCCYHEVPNMFFFSYCSVENRSGTRKVCLSHIVSCKQFYRLSFFMFTLLCNFFLVVK